MPGNYGPHPTKMAKHESEPPPFESDLRNIIELASQRRQLRGGSEEQQLAGRALSAALSALTEPALKKVQSLMYAGRDGESIPVVHRAPPHNSTPICVSILFEKLPLDKYLEAGIICARRDGIDLEADFNMLPLSRRSSTSADPEAEDLEWWENFNGDVRDMYVPRGLWKWARFDTPELASRVRPAAAIDTARGVLNDSLIVITGPTGAGKTALAIAMVASLPKAAHVRHYEIRTHGWGRAGVPDTAAWVARTVPTLLIDDMLESPMRGDPESPWVRAEVEVNALLARVIKERRARKQQTIIVSTSRDKFERQFGTEMTELVFSSTVIELDPTYRYNEKLDQDAVH
jgi:hypothetical protein